MARRVVAALAVVAVTMSVAACTPGDDQADPAVRQPARTDQASRAVAYDRSCPDLPRAQPVADGLPDLELPCLEDGPSVNLADLRGTPTVLNVWAAWCTNCYREMPLFADAMDRAGDRVRFFGVHFKASRGQGLGAEEDFGVPFPSVHDGDGDLTTARLRASAPPQTFFVTAGGRVAGRKVGEITSQDELDRLVRRYLGVRL